MADICDIAQQAEERLRSAALARIQDRPGDPGPHMVQGRACCRACGEPIPEARLAALPGIGTCVRCAQAAEGAKRAEVEGQG